MKKPILAGGGALLCLGVAVALLMVVPVATQEPGPRFSAWGQATPLGEPFTEVGQQQGCPFIAKDDLNLYFRARILRSGTSNRDWDIFVSHRESVDDPWGTPVNLGSEINAPTPVGNNTGGPIYSNELCSFVTIDGHWLYFVSNRLGGYGLGDLWLAHRKDKDDPTGWETPVNLGPNVNTTNGETGPSIFEDEASGKTMLYFSRTYPVSGSSPPRNGNKIWQVELLDWDNPGTPALVAELNTTGENNMHTFVRRKDGLEVIFVSDRAGGLGWWELWTSTRPSTSSPWSTPVHLGELVNSAYDETRPSLSWDGTTLYFWTDRESWMIHLYKSERTKITGKK